MARNDRRLNSSNLTFFKNRTLNNHKISNLFLYNYNYKLIVSLKEILENRFFFLGSYTSIHLKKWTIVLREYLRCKQKLIFTNFRVAL